MVALNDQCEINEEVGGTIKVLFNCWGMLKMWKHLSEFQIVQSVKYYFHKTDRIMKPDYVATQRDMLRGCIDKNLRKKSPKLEIDEWKL